MILCGPTGVFVLFASVVFGVLGEAAQEVDGNQSGANQLPGQLPIAINKILGKECKAGYSPQCLKLGVIWLIGRSGRFDFPVLPGVSINSPGLPISPEPMSSNIIDEPDKVDEILLERLSDYLGTLSINVKVLDKKAPLGFAKTILGEDPAAVTETARKKNRFGGALAAAGLMSGGTMLAMGMAALAAMAGKALMASLLALMLAAISALKGSGGGGSEKTTYEIVAKPVVSHLSTHSSEVQHGHGGHYRRSMDLMDVQPVVYSAHIPVARR